MISKGYLVRHVYVDSSWFHLISGNKSVFPFLIQKRVREDFRKENLYPSFQEDGGGRKTHPMSAFSQLPSTQNDPHARFGVACSNPLQIYHDKVGLSRECKVTLLFENQSMSIITLA